MNDESVKEMHNTEYWTGVGAAYGTAKSGIGIANVGTFRPDLIMKVHKGRHTQKEQCLTLEHSP